MEISVRRGQQRRCVDCIGRHIKMKMAALAMPWSLIAGILDSSPIQTWVATEIIKEVGLEEKDHPIIQGILQYLASGKDFDGHTWANTIASNNNVPHAPWWDYDPAAEASYNPTRKSDYVYFEICGIGKAGSLP